MVYWTSSFKLTALCPRQHVVHVLAVTWVSWLKGNAQFPLQTVTSVVVWGHVDSEVYLASPYVAAASAVLGRIAGLRRFNMDFESKKIWRYGDDVDTDVIIPARYLAIADWNELAEHAMEDIDTTFAPQCESWRNHGSW